MTIELSLADQMVQVDVVARRPALRLAIDGRTHDVEDSPGGDGSFEIVVDGTSYRGFRLLTPDGVWVHFQGRTFVARRRSLGAERGAAIGGLEVQTEMPGTVVSVHVAEGARVAAGDPLVTLESMKLQLTVNADRNGEIARIFLEAGATFERGTTLLAYRADAPGGPAPTEELR